MEVTPHIIKVTPITKYFSVSWRLSKRCNYDCMYCAPEWHDNTSKHHSLDELKGYWTDIFSKSIGIGLKYKIAFTGGEVTNSKAFLPFLEWLRANYSEHIGQILVTTNGSATAKYYTRLFEVVDNISFSTHSEHIDEQKFFGMILELKRTLPASKFIHVNIMNEFWNQDRILMYEKLLIDNSISYNINKIEYSKQTRSHPIFNGALNLEI